MNAIVKHTTQLTSLMRAYFTAIDRERKQTLTDAGCITAWEHQGIKTAEKKGND